MKGLQSTKSHVTLVLYFCRREDKELFQPHKGLWKGLR